MTESPEGSRSETPGPSQTAFLETLQRERVAVNVYLIGGIRLQGVIESFDEYVVSLRNNHALQVLYKRAISTITPGLEVRPPRARDPGISTARERTEPISVEGSTHRLALPRRKPTDPP